MYFLKVRSEPDADSSVLLSLFDPSEIQDLGGLPAEAICAEVEGVSDLDTLSDNLEIDVQHVKVNPVFREFLHTSIADFGSHDEGLLDAAREQGTGYLYIIDLRTPDPEGDVPAEDIVGAFEVVEGKITAESYSPNREHRIFSEHGLVQLPGSLREAMLVRLRSRATPAGS